MAKRVNNSVIHSLAERMFVEEGLTAKAIAEATDMSEQTIGRWRKDGGWEDKRKQFLQAPQNIKKAITEELQRLAQGYDPRLDMKAINDAIKAQREISDEISTQVVYSVFKDFDNWMSSQDPEQAIKFLEWHKLYLLFKAQQES